MTIVTSTTACNTNLSNTISFENSCNYRDASFSSYLNGDEGMLSLKLVDSHQNTSSPLSSSHDHIYTGKKKVQDTEIGVFSAEKYFKGAMDEDGNPKTSEHGSRRYHQPGKDTQMHIDLVKPKAQPRTPSIRSVSSWNSQRQLLPRNQQHKKMSKVQNKSFLSSLGCGCSCSDKNSVDINDHVSGNSGVTQNKAIIEQATKAGDLVQTNKSVSNTWTEDTHRKKVNDVGGKLNKEDCFSFPVLNSKQEKLTVKVKSPGIGDDVTRKSLEVFGSPILENKNKSSSFERKVIMLPRDVVPLTAEETEILGSPNLMYNDTDSDASSDLFEIESFSTKSNSLLATQKSQGIPGCVTPTPCYAPSDASITWSVVTASAADFSIVSDSEELRTTANTPNFNKIIGNAKSTPGKEINKRSANVFLGCKSQKAVRVVGDAHKRSEKAVPGAQGRCRLDPCKPVATFQAETKLAGLGSTQVHKAFNTRSVSPAHLLYIQ